MNEHYSTDQLADHDAGLVDAAHEHGMSQHLPTCPDCSDRLAAVQRVSVLLAAQPAPAMPEDVFARLHHTVGSLAAIELRNADLPDDRSGRPQIQPDPDAYADQDHPAPAPLAEDRALPGGLEKNPGWLRPTMGRLEKNVVRRRRPAKVLLAVLGTCGLAAAVGFGGFVLSSASGHNEPVAGDPLVVTDGLSSATELQNHSGLSPHRFSEAWNCARQVTSGRITGIRVSVVNERTGFLVFLNGAGKSTRVVFVSGCGTTPSAGPSTVLPGR